MKRLLLFCVLCNALIAAKGQDIQRRINFKPIDNDSLNISLNADYYLIEDSCASITRHIRLNFDTKKFHGRFTDIRNDNPAVILTEGNYTADGLKDGTFTLRYNSGNIKAKGNFKNDAFDGKWEMFYENGKPELTFEVNNGVDNILEAWDENGSKTIDKGNGTYISDAKVLSWKGKLVNGRPDGTWKMYSNSDKFRQTINTEHFKKGEFVDGENQIGNYIGQSRMILVNPAMFPFINAEKMNIGQPCGGPVNRFVNAQFKSGLTSFKHHIEDALSRYLGNVGYDGLDGSFYIIGDVDITGHIINLKKGGGYIPNIDQGVIKLIEGLPQVIPATVDGKPIVQRFKISLTVNKLGCSGSFEFLPVKY